MDGGAQIEIGPDPFADLGGGAPYGDAVAEHEIQAVSLVWRATDPEEQALDERWLRATADARTFYHDRSEPLEKLLARTRDLRVCVRQVESLAWNGGAAAVHAAMAGLVALSERGWAEVHPGPADDRKAARARKSAFEPLRGRGLVAPLQHEVILEAGRDGSLTPRLLHHASGGHEGTNRLPPQEGEGVLSGADVDRIVAEREALPTLEAHAFHLKGIAQALQDLEVLLTAQPGFERMQFGALRADVEALAAAVTRFAAPPAADGETSSAAAVDDDAAIPEAAPGAAPAGPTAAPRGELSPAAADALFDDVLRAYGSAARSSPVTLALMKLRSLRGRGFTAWLQTLRPEVGGDTFLPLWDVDMDKLDAFLEGEEPEPVAGGAAPAEVEGLAEIEAELARLAELADEVRRMLPPRPDGPDDEPPDPNRVAWRMEEVHAKVTERWRTTVPQAQQAAAAGGGDGGGGPLGDGVQPVDRRWAKASLQALAKHWRRRDPADPTGLCLEKLADLVEMEFVAVMGAVLGTDSARPRLLLARTRPRD